MMTMSWNRKHQFLPLVSLLLCCLSAMVSTAFAVDRSKFRTCEQTTFCRRNRTPLVSDTYKLVPESVHFHDPALASSEQQGDHHEQQQQQQQQQHGGGNMLWKSLSKRFLSSHHVDADEVHDPYVRGPPPTLTGLLRNTVKKHEELSWSLTALQDGMIRMRITELYGTRKSAFEKARVTYDELVLQSSSLRPAATAKWIRPGKDGGDEDRVLEKLLGTSKKNIHDYMALQFSDDDDDDASTILLIQLNPFAVSLYRKQGDEFVGPIVSAGSRMYFEQRRFRNQAPGSTSGSESASQDEALQHLTDDADANKKPEKEIVGYWEDGLAIYADGTREEKHEEEIARNLSEMDHDESELWFDVFGSHNHTNLQGPTSVGMDIAFSSPYLYGIPEHAASAVLQTTIGNNAHFKEPYRLYNLDVFQYELDETMALYGHIPLIVSQSETTGTSGIFWFNPTETFVDVFEQGDVGEDNANDNHSNMATRWMSESGVVDLFFLSGPNPSSFYRQYSKITGVAPLPPIFSLGYHQCRWNYRDEKDVYDVHNMFEELDYPYDVLWLDIEHTDGKRYFTWDKHLFPTPHAMLDKLASQGRRMVTIIDPHIKRDDNYYIHKEATAKGLYIKDSAGKNDFDGWCWPGSSSYLDFTSERVRSWWAEQFSYEKYQGSTPTLFTWNDMNEPSVFNGPEVSMQKDLRNLNGEEHRQWHNLYGMLFHRATMEGQIRRNQPEEDVRPFVLSRSFFAGSQRYGAIWTGDNAAEWSHLAIATPMLLSMNSAALTFVGADVGGFFGDPDAELFTRWMQAGAYTPFFRGHAHHDSKRREPWTFDDETLVRLRHAAMARYALLPYWYTVFHQAETTGMPVMRMMWMEYPDTPALYNLDDQYLVGSDLLVKPVTSPQVTETQVQFPAKDIWYNVDTMKVVDKSSSSSNSSPNGVDIITVPSDIDTIPVFQRGGSVIVRRLRLRRSTMMMSSDPYTLYVALDAPQKAASGELYMDDGETFGYQRRFEFANATFRADFSVGMITNQVTVGSGWLDKTDIASKHMIERVIVMGCNKTPSKITVTGASSENQVEELEFQHDPSSQVLVIRKPQVSAMKEWEMKIST